MICSENALNILTAKTYKGIGKAWIVKNLREKKSVNEIVFLLNGSTKNHFTITLDEFKKNKAKIRQNILALEGIIDGITAIGDRDFPCHRGKVKNSEQPIVLFYRGDLSLLSLTSKNIAVIGVLNPDREIETVEQEVVEEFVKNGATIISGLALGCDSVAHRQALCSKGKTVAILPSPLTNILPAKNSKLAEEIVENNGLLITEYYENAKSRRELGGRYQERDRLQALFSDSIVLAASYAKNDCGNDSGSRLAMGYALSYSIPRAVIYDPATDEDNPKYDLNRQLIAEQNEKIAIVNRHNLKTTVAEILAPTASNQNFQPAQTDLFELLNV